MKNIDDEMLNNFIDNQLSDKELDFIKSAIANSPVIKKRYEMLLKVDNHLKQCGDDNLPADFTILIMNKINRRLKREKQQKSFLVIVLSLFILITVGLVSFILFEMINSAQIEKSSDIIMNYSHNISQLFSNLIGKKNLSIIGSVLSLIMLVSGYYLFELQKRTRKNLFH